MIDNLNTVLLSTLALLLFLYCGRRLANHISAVSIAPSLMNGINKVFCAALETDVAVYQFQEDDAPSDSYLAWQGNLDKAFDNVNSLTICTRLRFFSVWKVSRYIQLTDERTGQHNIQIGR